MEQDLRLPSTHLAIVIHATRHTAGQIRYDLSLGGDERLIRAMRATFPARSAGPCRVRLGRRGGLDLCDVALCDIVAAGTRAARAGDPHGGAA